MSSPFGVESPGSEPPAFRAGPSSRNSKESQKMSAIDPVPLRSWQHLRALGALGALLVLASGCTLISLDKRSAYHLENPFAVEDDAFRRSLDAFGNAMVGGNQAEILNNGDAIFPALTEAIRNAKATVDLESYIFKDDKAGGIVAAALIDAARRGVEVRVLVDGTGSFWSGALLDRLKQAGVKAYVFHPIRPWSLYKIGRRSHRKILVVDGRISFTGGFCIADQWM